jgi:protein-tyrosine-phosphatase
MKRVSIAAALVCGLTAAASGQDMPADYKDVLTVLGKQGDYKANVLKVNIPRNDVSVTVAGVKTPTPFGFGGWVAMTKGTGGTDVMMGDLVLTQDEVNPVMSALLENGLDVTALHNHFLWDEPRMFYMHVHGHGPAGELAKRVKPALDLIGRNTPKAAATPAATAPASTLDTAKLAQIVGAQGEQSGAVYKITIGRDDLKLTEMGAPINARMGLNTWAAFVGTNENAAVAGDVAMLANEVTPVLKALRKNGLDVVAIHHHMTDTRPTIYFLHYWGTGAAEKLATGFKAAVSELGKSTAPSAAALAGPTAEPTVVFVCEHGAAKSVIATAYFNKIAAERGLQARASYRGVNPQADLSVTAMKGLKDDGLSVDEHKPVPISQSDVDAATVIFAIGCTLPSSATASGKAASWDDVPEDRGYGPTRDAIKRHVEDLVDRMLAQQG